MRSTLSATFLPNACAVSLRCRMRIQALEHEHHLEVVEQAVEWRSIAVRRG